MTSWNDGDEPDEPEGEVDDFRDHIGSAEPPPVTEAMITPRTKASGASPVSTGSTCQVCDEQNQPGASYCMACGVSLTAASDTEPLPWVDADEPGFDAGAGLLDLGEMEEIGARVEEQPTGAERDSPDTSPRITGRHILAGLVTVAVVILLYTTYVNTDSPDTDTSATTAADPDALSRYTASIDAIAQTVADLRIDAAAINEAWENSNAEYQATLTALSGLQSRAAALPDLLGALTAPEVIGLASHQRIVTSSNTIASAATEMVEGLESTDSGEARQAALKKFDAASAEFASLVRIAGQSTPPPTDQG